MFASLVLLLDAFGGSCSSIGHSDLDLLSSSFCGTDSSEYSWGLIRFRLPVTIKPSLLLVVFLTRDLVGMITTISWLLILNYWRQIIYEVLGNYLFMVVSFQRTNPQIPS